MKKKLIAFAAAVLMTACVGIAILLIGGAALFNKNGVAASNSAGNKVAVNVAADQATQIQQMQDLINQYQAREKQYQQREQQYQAQIQQFQQQIAQVQSLLEFLQSRGLIQITPDGRIVVNQ